MSIEAASEVEFAPAGLEDLQFIRAQLEGERLDTERLEPEQFITIREGERIIACGRIKAYETTYELGSIWVAEDRRGRGLGEMITRELVRRFPQDEVYITTDAAVGLPAYYERMGFLRTRILPAELVAKIKRVCETLKRDAVGMVYDRRIERLPTIAETYRAKHVLENYLPRTPLRHNPTLSRELSCAAYLKLENLQPIGAFKVRGGVYLASTLNDEERRRGIIGASTGNHGQSLAYGANLFGIRCVIAMPEEANPMKVESMRALGAELQFQGENFEEARLWAEETGRREEMRYIHHINAPELLAGVSTISLEIIEDLPDVDVIITPIGGGSAAIGHCLMAKALRSNVQVIGVQAEGAPAVYHSWREHELQTSEIETTAEGLATGQAYYTAVKTFIDRMDDMLLVRDEEMRQAVVLLLRAAHVVAEESGAAATAAAMKLREHLAGKEVAIVVSGGNMTLDSLGRVLRDAS